MSQYVGQYISIVNNERVRYVGILASISGETASLVLQNVKVYGTEDRVAEGDSLPIVPEKENKIPSLSFKGSDVSDLQVLDNESLDNDEENEDEDEDEKKQTTSAILADIDEDDFSARTQRLSLEDVRDTTVKPVYNKSDSFFDNLGPVQTFGEPSRPNFSNQETFGISESYGSSRGRGGRGRGGRGRGRGRGGYYSQGYDRSYDSEFNNDGYRDNHRDNYRDSQREHHTDHHTDKEGDDFQYVNRGSHSRGRGRGGPRGGPRGGRGGSRGRGGRGGRGGAQSTNNESETRTRPTSNSKRGQDHNEFIPGGQFA